VNTESQQRYRRHSAALDLPLYFQPLWLDAVAGEAGWDAAMAFDPEGRLSGVWVYCLSKRWGLPVINMPPLTAYSGPWLRYPPHTDTPKNRYAFEIKVMNELMAQLPSVAFFYQEWHPDLTNWLPAYWRGFQQTTHYTYQIDDLSDPDALFAGFRGNVRTDIRKAEKELRVLESDSAEDLFRLYDMSFRRQGKTPSVSQSVLLRADETMHRKKQRLILLAEDDAGRLHAGLYLVWDAHTAYYLLGGSDPDLRSSGAMYLLVWYALQFCGRRGLHFDFEGSMLEPVEWVLRGFGGRMTPHHKIFRARNRGLKAVAALLGKSGF
jgi:hypothetical protein